jgi:hypothetical protein
MVYLLAVKLNVKGTGHRWINWFHEVRNLIQWPVFVNIVTNLCLHRRRIISCLCEGPLTSQKYPVSKLMARLAQNTDLFPVGRPETLPVLGFGSSAMHKNKQCKKSCLHAAQQSNSRMLATNYTLRKLYTVWGSK